MKGSFGETVAAKARVRALSWAASSNCLDLLSESKTPEPLCAGPGVSPLKLERRSTPWIMHYLLTACKVTPLVIVVQF